jgi:hypothetical protein
MSSHTTEGSSQAHYSITRGQQRRDPNFISCLNSDGDVSKWKETGPTVDSTGSTCYWKTDDPETQLLSDKWKRTLGKTAAKLLGLSDGLPYPLLSYSSQSHSSHLISPFPSNRF